MKIQNTLLLLCLNLLAIPLSGDPTNCKVFSSYNLVSQNAERKWFPVIGIENRKPLILTPKGIVPSSTGWMRSNPITMVNDQYVEILQMNPTEDESGIKIWVQMKSSHALVDAFAVLAYRYQGENDSSWIACKQDNIPDLTGEKQTFTVWFNNKNVPKGEWKLHIFHAGKELYDISRTDLQEASPQQNFNLQLFRRNTGVGKGDAKPAPFYIPMKKTDENLLPSGKESFVVKVEIVIGSKGNIVEHNFKSKLKPALQKHLSSNIEEWLFFPRIKSGVAVDQKVVMPIQLR